MNALVSIGLEDDIDKIRFQLQQQLASLNKQGLKVTVQESNRGSIIFLRCNLEEQEKEFYSPDGLKNFFLYHIADILADIIVKQYEKIILDKLLIQNYYYFNPEERKIIFDNACKLIEARETIKNRHYYCQHNRKQEIKAKIYEFLEANQEMVLGGFIKFRLKDYLQYLDDTLEQAVDDFVLEREYREFIRLLRYFVDVQEPHINEVHVIMKDSCAFNLLDSQGNQITHDLLEEFVTGGMDGEINYEDLLISALIALAPNLIVFHTPHHEGQTEVEATIKDVFDGRVVHCNSCEKCSKENKKSTLPKPNQNEFKK